jgi:hypothetical protein
LGWSGALVALAACLPFARSFLAGGSLYFRDLSLQFFPLRRFALDGLRAGELRYWNPYVHEGVPLSLPPVSYPLDLLQLLMPDERGLSLTLALHVPLAALGMMALARDLALSRTGAAAAGLVYALGGFCLSTLNLYVYVQAVAWAPFVILALRRAAACGGRHIAGAALATAVALSTTGLEVVAQTLAIGLALSPWYTSRPAALRLLGGLGLGFGLSAPTLFAMSGLVADSARGAGFEPEVVLAHSLHPLTLVQIVVAGLYGDPANITGRWWGINFFPRGFPYFLSLYLGACALAVAAVGSLAAHAPRRRLLALALGAGAVCLGDSIPGARAAVEALPPLQTLRYPSKAFFTIHLAAALFTGFGFDALLARAAAWRLLAGLALAGGVLLAAAPLLPALLPGPTRVFLAGFCPPEYPWPLRFGVARFVTADASMGGLFALAAGFLALGVLRGRVRTQLAAPALAGLIGGDLLRAGAGLNPTVTPSFFELSREMATEAARIRDSGGRVFTCDPAAAPAYQRARLARGVHHEAFTFATFMEALVPNFNVPFRVKTALSLDLTMLVPTDRVSTPEEARCGNLAALRGRLRAAGVAHLISLEPLEHEELRLRSVVRPQRITPLELRVYEWRDPLPLRQIAAGAGGRVSVVAESASRLRLSVEADEDALVLMRDAYADGWSARVNGARATVLRADGRHRAVAVPAGRSEVELRYRPPGVEQGLLAALLSTAALAAICVRARRRE